MNEAEVFEDCRNLVVVYEGLHTYGGMAGRDMEAMATGIVESVQDDHIQARVGQVEYLGAEAAGLGRADRRAHRRPRRLPRREGVLPHIDQDAVSGADAGGRAVRRLAACAPWSAAS